MTRDESVEAIEVDGYQPDQGREAVHPRQGTDETFFKEGTVGKASLPILAGIAQPMALCGLARNRKLDPSSNAFLGQVRWQQHVIGACKDRASRCIGTGVLGDHENWQVGYKAGEPCRAGGVALIEENGFDPSSTVKRHRLVQAPYEGNLQIRLDRIIAEAAYIAYSR